MCLYNFFEEYVTGDIYLTTIKYPLMPQLEKFGDGIPEWTQQDGATGHILI